MNEHAKIVVRTSISEDIASITDIYAVSVLTGFGTFEIKPPDMMEMTARRNTILEQQLPYLVAEHDGEVVGFAYAGVYRPRPAYQNTVENSVYVREGGRKKGVGKALLSTLIEECKKAGKKQMVAVIGDSGNRGSIKLHQSLGFRLVGILESVGYKHERWLDTVIMQKNLTDE
ncbi:GNAT family N-acetyltransferase [Sneathiella sp. HT1-7]|uniref:GNAT family N-acetyltransferase n=1 Tax=Sneathiella sp. HT1-7 TaxID=2887192 RepID=UPI001D1443E6|nr:GNAT family N-acetyltransferase [Sneathiella sp. HT1-7]MCC3306478.1 N-acetyltransferase family protein [Sneathiella sp. HT1-7]